MKKYTSGLLLVLSFLIMVIPFLGMSVAKTKTTTENRNLAAMPSLMEDGRFNISYLKELGTYFEDHYAFKNDLAYAAAYLKKRVFKESNVDTIVVGEQDWLYYTDTVEDYLGMDTVSDRGAYNIVYNLSLIQKKVEQAGADFLFTVAPNKNSLYGENMPSWLQNKASETSNMKKIAPLLETQKLPYADLFCAFANGNEVLYLKRDSHWNEKGAVLAYNVIMDQLGRKHDNFTMTPNERRKTKIGDLGKALYSYHAAPEWDYSYDYESKLSILEPSESAAGQGAEDLDSSNVWEAEWIRSESSHKDAEGSLLMFRDSFGNTLCKYIAEYFKQGAYAKGTVYFLDRYLEEIKPDQVLVEIVERNITRFGSFSLMNEHSYGPPIMSATEAMLGDIQVKDGTDAQQPKANLKVTVSQLQPSYYVLGGMVDPSVMQADSRIYVELSDGISNTVYDAYLVSCEDGSLGDGQDEDYGYMLYLPEGALAEDGMTVRVLTEQAGEYTLVLEETIELSELVPEE